MKYKSPCLNCKDREIGCHSKCEKYIAFQEKVAEAREARMREFRINEVRLINAEENARRHGKRFGDRIRR